MCEGKVLNDSRKFTVEGLDRAIVGEIKDELKIQVEDTEMSKHIVGFYRDVVEGGKPQFMFYYKCQWDAAKVKEEFKKALKKDKKKNKSIFATDGKKLREGLRKLAEWYKEFYLK